MPIPRVYFPPSFMVARRHYRTVTMWCFLSENSYADKHPKDFFWVVPPLNRAMSIMLKMTSTSLKISNVFCDQHHTIQTFVVRYWQGYYSWSTGTHTCTRVTSWLLRYPHCRRIVCLVFATVIARILKCSGHAVDIRIVSLWELVTKPSKVLNEL